ncbi:MAG: 30S ribosomal protein S7 [Chloroflexota bacterium]|nr:30S ribosomal protein S7 [Chloroflexota bacterium]
MPRRYRPERRDVPPDIRYGSELVARFVNRVMQRGKKSLARSIVYDAFDIIEEQTGKDALEVFEQAVNNATPRLEVKPRRVGGATYQIPVEVSSHRGRALAMRWLVTLAERQPHKDFVEKLAAELMDAANNTGSAIARRDETHRMAEANRAFAHYRW